MINQDQPVTWMSGGLLVPKFGQIGKSFRRVRSTHPTPLVVTYAILFSM